MTAIAEAVGRGKLRLRGLDEAALQKRLYAALYEHCRREMSLCQGAVNQLDPKEKQRVVGAYGVKHVWRWCATDDFQRTVDCLDELIRRAEIASSNDAKPVAAPVQDELDLEGGGDALRP